MHTYMYIHTYSHHPAAIICSDLISEQNNLSVLLNSYPLLYFIYFSLIHMSITCTQFLFSDNYESTASKFSAVLQLFRSALQSAKVLQAIITLIINIQSAPLFNVLKF